MSYSISMSTIIAAIAAPTYATRDVSRLRLDVTPNIDVVTGTSNGSTGKTAHVMSRTVRIYQDARVTTHVIPGI